LQVPQEKHPIFPPAGFILAGVFCYNSLMNMVKEIKVKSALVVSKLPDADYVINPYTGCAFGCSYCYASFMGRFVGKKIDDWGNYVFVKVNLIEVLEKQLEKIKDKTKTILLSSVTDPYQGIESKFQLTRGALKLLIKYKWEGKIGVLTKSSLVLRDIDLFKKLKKVEVGLTITTTDDKVSQFLERSAPPASLRLKALKKLNQEGIKTYAFVGPLLPHFSATPEKLKEIFDALKHAQVKELYLEHLNLSTYVKGRLLKKLKGEQDQVIRRFYEAGKGEYKEKLNKVITELLKNYDFKIRLGEVLEHGKNS